MPDGITKRIRSETEIVLAVNRTQLFYRGGAFRTREHLQNNYLSRMAAAALGIWGNRETEAIYIATEKLAGVPE